MILFDIRLGRWAVCGCDANIGLKQTCESRFSLLCSALSHGRNMPQISADPGKVRDVWRTSKPNPQVEAKPSQAQPPSVAKPLPTHRCLRKKESFSLICIEVFLWLVVTQQT